MASENIKKLELKRAFSSNFKRLKKEQGITHSQIYKRLGIPYASLWQWAEGRHLPRPHDLVALAGFFGVTINELLGQGKE